MTHELTSEYISRRMCELGYGSNYTIRMRHLVLQPTEERTIKSHNQFFFLVEPPCNVRIESTAGLFDLSDDYSNELQYEHRGDITITNHSIFMTHVRFIQVIPQKCKTPCH